MRANEATTITGRSNDIAHPTSGKGATTAPVLAAVWCRSVGTSWTLELHELDDGTTPGKITDWVSSGVPITQPKPEALANKLLAERGLQLFRDSSAGPCTHSRQGIGYVSADAELIKLAYQVWDGTTATTVHPVVLAARWIAAGFSADAAARWIHKGIRSPQMAQQKLPSTLTVSP